MASGSEPGKKSGNTHNEDTGYEGSRIAEAFNKPASRNFRLALSLLFITLATVVIMTIFQVAKNIIHPDITLYESQLYTILFAGLVAPLVALFVLLRFEGLYQKIYQDNEERKRAEEALRESEAKFRALFEGAGAAIFVADVATGRIIDCNLKAEELIGRPRGEVIGLHQTQLHPVDQAEAQREQFARHARGIVLDNDEALVQHRDGRVIHVIVNAAPLKLNGRDIMIGFFLDITERKWAEEALKESEEKFRALAEASPAMILFHQGGKYIYVNPAAEAVTGYTRDELLDLDFWMLVAPEYRELVKDRGLARLQGENPHTHYRVKLLAKQGSERWIELSSARMEYRGKPAIMVTALDITERRQAEEALMKRESDLSLSQRIAHIGSWRWDEATGRNEWSDEFYRILGYKPGEIKPNGELYLSMVHPDDREMVIHDSMMAYDDNRPSSLDYRMIRRDGEIRHVHVEINRIKKDKHGKLVGEFGIIQDITNRKRGEEERARLSALMDHSPSLVFMKDESGRYVYLNKSYEKQFVHSEDWYGKTDFDFWPKESAELFRLNDEEVLRSGRVHQFLEDSTDLHGKRYCWLNYKFPFIDSNGNRYVGGIGIDATDRVRAEEALEEAKAQAELYVDLMGHDINNMHQIALGYLELAREMPDAGAQGEFLDKSMEVLQRSTALIDNVRKLQKVHDGVFKTQDIDVSFVLLDVQREYGALPNKPVTLNVNGHANCYVRANELLHDVFANLVSNAIKHTGDKTSINLTLDVENYNGIRYCRVVVEDDGPGIPDESKAMIFNRTLKGTNKAKGMGLGLYLVKSLVDSYGGRIWVEDRVLGDYSKGARFVVLLPAVEK